MKKALLTACLTAALVAAPLASTAANAAPALNPVRSQLRIDGSLRTAHLITASGDVTVQWGQPDGPGATEGGRTFLISRTHPVGGFTVVQTNRAGRNAIIALLKADRAQLAAGEQPFASIDGFIRSIKVAAKRH